MNIVKVLETIGASSSLNQFESVEELLQNAEINTSLLTEIKTQKIELVCVIFPEQDEPDEDTDDTDDVD